MNQPGNFMEVRLLSLRQGLAPVDEARCEVVMASWLGGWWYFFPKVKLEVIDIFPPWKLKV